MYAGKQEYRIPDQTLENVLLRLREFENKYRGYHGQWDCELCGQQNNLTMLQLIDHGYDTPREKGQSAASIYRICATTAGEDVLLQWKLQWKSSRQSFSSIGLWILLVSCLVVFVGLKGDTKVLYGGIWGYAALLYSGWVAQNCWHDRLSQQVFLELLRSCFGAERETP